MFSEDVLQTVSNTGTLPSEFVITALSAALCKLVDGQHCVVDIDVDGLGVRIEVINGGIAIFGRDANPFEDTFGPLAIAGI